MKKKTQNRRNFIRNASLGSAALMAAGIPGFAGQQNSRKLAILGGTPVRQKEWPKWPSMIVDENMLTAITETTKSGNWSRINNMQNGTVARFERAYAALMGTRYCVGTGSGTQALSTCVEAMGIGPGDEVITSPYTDFGSVSAIIGSRALAVLADLDADSFQLDPADVERKITQNTRAIMPVHIMGSACDMQAIMAIAKKHNLLVIEDACQANFAKYQGRQLGTMGHLGCFSFQASKQIACGEGGAVIGNDEALMEKVYTVQNHGTNRKGANVTIGPKYRMNELEGSILLAQLDKAYDRFTLRNKNAAYLTEKLKGLNGLTPQKQYPGAESSGYYLYALRYRKEAFGGAERSQFLKAVAAEGINLNGYIKGLNREPWTDHILQLKSYQQLYSHARRKLFKEQLVLPTCDQVTNEVIVLSGSGPLLGSVQDMDDIINAITKVYENKEQLKSIPV
ncbi:MAG TPA: DegT/DnrJ/EryC1/StrS family aminotransferase [Flavihumibacter sp.]|nr:DegT/DnrJ/EryC1/StrS family aminotransferase [Bacteroidota bacterium]HOA38374.1 DegT/DnrJ/EryC1/StrS family aminotransferase [Flavihumibacter sp.]HQD08288.1 DegT/DnrJ/EryC1/StrS family aminotransferase [Flavihumibacter sp.]